MTGLYRVTYFIGTPDSQIKISEMLDANSAEEAIALVKAKHPTDLGKISSVAMLR
jgi:hypothetical protein